MTASAIRLLHAAIADAAAPAGFRKQGSSWYCEEAEATLVVNPQKSQYGSRYFLNLGIYWRALGQKSTPKEEECHVRGRISSVLPEELCRRLDRSLDFEDSSISDEARRVAVRDALVQHAIPLLKRCSTAEGLREEYGKSNLKRFLVARRLGMVLDLEP
jgi:hypothetical protein